VPSWNRSNRKNSSTGSSDAVAMKASWISLPNSASGCSCGAASSAAPPPKK
jgi:hypothetical protein